MNKIVVREHVKNALTETNGITLRGLMVETITQMLPSEFDFSDIKLFATVCFNASVGYVIFNCGKDNYDKYVSVINLSPSGESAYKHSYENAVEFSNKRTQDQVDHEAIANNLMNGEI